MIVSYLGWTRPRSLPLWAAGVCGSNKRYTTKQQRQRQAAGWISPWHSLSKGAAVNTAFECAGRNETMTQFERELKDWHD